MLTVDRYSLSSIPLSCLTANRVPLGVATGFIYSRNEEIYLVSNWHVLSGRNPNTGQPRHSNGATPEILSLPLMAKGKMGNWKGVEIALMADQGGVRWLQHAEEGQKVDIAVLKLPPLPDVVEAFPLNTGNEVDDMVLGAGHDVFVLGFPLGQTKQAALPVWKRASIASEPDIPLDDGTRCFLIDTSTREGMSGSPVIARKLGGYRSTEGVQKMGADAVSILGVYSGRYVGDDLEGMQLGIVWKLELLHEIIDAGVQGTYELL